MFWGVLIVTVLWLAVFAILWAVASASGQADHQWQHDREQER